MRHGQGEDVRLVGVFVGVAGAVHHPAPAGLDPCHARKGEAWRGGETLLLDGGEGDLGGVSLVEGYALGGVGGADLTVWYAGLGFHDLNFARSRMLF